MPALTKTSSSRPTPPWRPHNRNSPPQQGKGGNAAAAMTPACPKPTKNQSYAEPVQLSRPEYPSQSPTHHADTQISPITLKSSASKTPREKSGSVVAFVGMRSLAGILGSHRLKITRITFLACRAHYPGGPERVPSVGYSPVPRGLPLISGGSASTSSLSRPAQASLAFGPQGRSTAQGGLCHRASVPPVTRQDRLSATRSNRQPSGWILPPLVLRAVGAH